MARRRIRLLHTSDWHLFADLTPRDGTHHDPCRCVLDGVAALVAEHQPDGIVHTGDLFDHARVSAATVAAVLTEVAALGPPVLLLPGNHDVFDHTSPFHKAPEHLGGDGQISFFDDHGGTVHRWLGGAVTAWGRAMPMHEPAFRPLHGVPSPPADATSWFVVLGHGHHVGDEPPELQGRSSPITAGDIAATGADYVALGHWHRVTDVSAAGVAAWYAGSPQPGYGDGNALLVDLCPSDGVTVTPVAAVPPAGGCAPA
jgi:DNA repair exonuclease SbcCD nuclease subunit